MSETESDCTHILTQIELFLDDELEAGRCTEIRAHLEACSECSDRTSFKLHIKTLVQSKCACVDQVPPELMARVMGRLQEDEATS